MIKKMLVVVTLCAISALAFAKDEATEPTLKAGDPAPKPAWGDFVQGERFTEFEKGKVYVVEFWATWCAPCRASIPHLNELAKKLQDKGVVIVGQNVSEKNDKTVVPAFVKKMGEKMTYRVALDDKSKEEKGAMSTTWMDAAGAKGIPISFVVDKAGKIAWIGHPMDELDKVVEGVMAGTFDAKKHAEAAAARENALEKLGTAIMNEKWDEALTILNDVEKTGNVLPTEDLQQVRRQILFGKKDADGVVKLLAAMGEKNNDDHEALHKLALQIATTPWLKPGLPLADKLATRANKLSEGKDADILDTLARVKFMNGDKDKAIELQKKAIAVAGDEDLKKELEIKLASYQKGILPAVDEDVQPKSRESMLTDQEALSACWDKVNAAINNKKWDEATAAIDEFVKIAPKKMANNIWEARLQIFLSKKDTDAAIKLVTKVGRENDDNVEVLNGLAWEIMTKDVLKSALPLADKLATRANKLSEGKDADILDTLARVKFMNGDKDKAIELQKKAIEVAEFEDLKKRLEKTLASYQKGVLDE